MEFVCASRSAMLYLTDRLLTFYVRTPDLTAVTFTSLVLYFGPPSSLTAPVSLRTD
jgi:hypothetical protein